MATHDVLNQPPPLEDYDVFGADTALVEAVPRHGASWAVAQLHELGTRAGSAESIGWGFTANENPPRLRTHDRFGHRIDAVDYHPAYHELMRVALDHELHGSPWRDARAGAHVGARRGVHGVEPGRRRARLPGVDDVRDRPRAPDRADARGPLGAPADQPDL